jgi:hypothetical protein
MDKLLSKFNQYKHSGKIFTFVFIIASIMTIITPIIQILTIIVSIFILQIVRLFIGEIKSSNNCILELVIMCIIYFGAATLVAIMFYRKHSKKSIDIIGLFMFLCYQFIILQAPIFILLIGTYYNCKTDGQSVLGVIISSFWVSVFLFPFGIVYDIIKNKNKKKAIENL